MDFQRSIWNLNPTSVETGGAVWPSYVMSQTSPTTPSSQGSKRGQATGADPGAAVHALHAAPVLAGPLLWQGAAAAAGAASAPAAAAGAGPLGAPVAAAPPPPAGPPAFAAPTAPHTGIAIWSQPGLTREPGEEKRQPGPALGFSTPLPLLVLSQDKLGRQDWCVNADRSSGWQLTMMANYSYLLLSRNHPQLLFAADCPRGLALHQGQLSGCSCSKATGQKKNVLQ